MTKYTYSPAGLVNQDTGAVEPFNRNAPVTLPQIMRGDEQEALLSYADGKMYTSKAAMRASYKASGNPQGVEYIEVGDDQSRKKKPARVKSDPAAIKSSVERAVADLENGRFGQA